MTDKTTDKLFETMKPGRALASMAIPTMMIRPGAGDNTAASAVIFIAARRKLYRAAPAE